MNTAWGCGFVERVRPNDYVVRLKVWALAQGQSPHLYLSEAAITRMPQDCYPGAEVTTFCGPAKVLQIRPNNVLVCQPSVWKLADYAPDIFMYMNFDAVKNRC